MQTKCIFLCGDLGVCNAPSVGGGERLLKAVCEARRAVAAVKEHKNMKQKNVIKDDIFYIENIVYN